MSEHETPPTDHEPPTLLGLHVISREGDLHFIRINGPLRLEDAQHFHGAVAESRRRYGSVYVLVDSSGAGAITPETRRWIAEWNKTHHVNGVAIFGSSLVVRTLLTLVLHAIALLRSQAVPSVFVKDEAAARAWLQDLRSLSG